MKIYFLSFAILFSTVATAAKANLPVSKLKEISITAESSSRDNENDTIDLEGSIQIIYQLNHLSADKARINMRSKTLDATGRVMIVTNQATIGGDRVILDYETNTGIIYNGYVQAGNVIFEGTVLHKVSENSYIADEGKYTTCTNCPETWSFSGSRIRAELGGYAYIKNSLIRFGGIPSLWLPYLVVPLQSDRQTGLLTPSFEKTSAGGIGFTNSFFWAIDRSRDATVTVKTYELRGLKSLINYRYMLTENSQGELDFGYLPDRAFINETRAKSWRPKGDSFNRWFLKYDHYYEMPEGYVQRMQLNNASDLQYPSDFSLETRNNGDPAMENRTSVTKNTANQHMSIDTSYYVNLLSNDPFAKNSFAVHRLPEIRYAAPVNKVGSSNFLYSFDIDYTNFARTGQAWDTLETTGTLAGGKQLRRVDASGTPCDDRFGERVDCVYQPDPKYVQPDPTHGTMGDMIRTGQRFDTQASLLRPIQISNFFNLIPKLTYRETHYFFPIDDQPYAARRFIRGELASQMSFSRIYDNENLGKIKHEIVPEVTMSANSPITNPNHPFFGQNYNSAYFPSENISDLDLNGPNGVQFDYSDRVSTSRLVTFAVTNKFTRKLINDGNTSYFQFLFWKLSQSYDAALANSTDPSRQPYSDVASTMYLNLGNLHFYQLSNYYPYQQVTKSTTQIRLANDYGDYAQLDYKDDYNISPGNLLPPDINTRETTITLKKDFKWIDLIGKFTYDTNPNSTTDRVKSSGYGAKLKLLGDCLHITVISFKNTKGEFEESYAFSFSWDGNKIPRISDSILDMF